MQATTPALDPFNLDQASEALQNTPFAGQIHHFQEIDSTSTHALAQAANHQAPHGSVYIADLQTAGRGRGTHTWTSPAGSGLYTSILLRPQLAPGDALWYSLAAGLATLNAIRVTTGLTPDLRWPNDILLNTRKTAGILTEMHAEATRVRHMVIGIGINLHQQHFPTELATATSLALEGGQTTRTQLLIALLQSLNKELNTLTTPESHQALLTRLESASTWIRGKQVTVEEGQPGATTHFHGFTAGLNQQGFLQVRTSEGTRTVLSGGVRERSL